MLLLLFYIGIIIIVITIITVIHTIWDGGYT